MQCIPIRDLKDTAAVSALCKNSPTPICVTKNGYSEMIIMSPEVYDRIRLYDVLEKAMEGQQDIADGRSVRAKDAIQMLREKHGLRSHLVQSGVE